MAKVNHAERAHAFLSASSASRWLACTPSALAESKQPNTTSEAAEEGTAAHEYSELLLEFEMGGFEGRMAFEKALKKFEETNKYYKPEMKRYIEDYVDYVLEATAELGKASKLHVENRVDFSKFVPEGFGTSDIIIEGDDTIHIIDLKYGRGEVSAKNNPQLRLYAIGSIEKVDSEKGWKKFKNVKMTIYQPRIGNISTDEMSTKDLKTWAETWVKPRAEKAFNGEGFHVPGDHCTFCKIASTCRALATQNLALEDFSEPEELTLDEIAGILPRIPRLIKWAKQVENFALKQAEAGEEVTGYKVVEKRTQRRITDQDEAALALIMEGVEADEIYQPRKLNGLTALEKAVGGSKKLHELIGDLIVKPEGKPELVPESDRRPPMQTAEDIFNDLI